jgi:hypothetical protein
VTYCSCEKREDGIRLVHIALYPQGIVVTLSEEGFVAVMDERTGTRHRRNLRLYSRWHTVRSLGDELPWRTKKEVPNKVGYRSSIVEAKLQASEMLHMKPYNLHRSRSSFCIMLLISIC